MFDGLLPAGQETFTTKEVAGLLDLDDQTIRNAAEEGKIKGHRVSGRGRRNVTWRFQRRAVVLWLATSANYEAIDLYHEYIASFRALPEGFLQELANHLNKKLNGQTKW